MGTILDIFLEITQIPRCSHNTQKMEEYLIDKIKRFGYTVQIDGAKNILASSKNPKICLQAHYDMVCVGDAPKIEPVIEGNILKAKNSSLGADNGIAIAMMLKLMSEGAEAEFLFTNDEEVGLIGAKNLELNIKSPYLLNLDSEDEKEVYIGCAGGTDVLLERELKNKKKKGRFFEISITDLPGGHSGVDIDKNIPNAIIELAKYIKANSCQIVRFKGGERINSIAANAKATVFAQNLTPQNGIEIKEIGGEFEVTDFDIEDILSLPNGVLEFNKEFDVVESSANVALADIGDKMAKIEVSLRSLDNSKLDAIAKEIQEQFKEKYTVKLYGKYPGWKPQVNQFTQTVQEALKKIFGECKTKVIHAGLECGILSQKLPSTQMASIGPNIRYPHSTREFTELDSVEKTYIAVKEIINKV